MIRMTNVSILPGEKPLTLGTTDCLDGSRHSDADESFLVHRRQAVQLPVRVRDRLGDQEWQARAHAEESLVLGYHDGILEFHGRDLLAPDEWTLWGTPNCGKGQPQQVMGTGHGASPARFRGIKMGSAFQGISYNGIDEERKSTD